MTSQTFNRAINSHPAKAEAEKFAEQLQDKPTKQLNVKIDLELYKFAKTKATEQNLKLYQYIEKLIEKETL